VGWVWIILIVLLSLAVIAALMAFTPIGRVTAAKVAPWAMRSKRIRRMATRRAVRTMSTPQGLEKMMRADDPATRDLAKRLKSMGPRERRQVIATIERMSEAGQMPGPDDVPPQGRAQRRAGGKPVPQRPPGRRNSRGGR
jgi:hypothetical protein